MHGKLPSNNNERENEIFEENCSAYPAYYHIKYVYGKNPCGHFNYVRVGVARITEGNNVENVCPSGQCGNGKWIQELTTHE